MDLAREHSCRLNLSRWARAHALSVCQAHAHFGLPRGVARAPSISRIDSFLTVALFGRSFLGVSDYRSVLESKRAPGEGWGSPSEFSRPSLKPALRMRKIFKILRRRERSPSGSSSPRRDSEVRPLVPGAGYVIRMKDLGKIHKAASFGDVARVQHLLLLGQAHVDDLDKEKRWEGAGGERRDGPPQEQCKTPPPPPSLHESACALANPWKTCPLSTWARAGAGSASWRLDPKFWVLVTPDPPACPFLMEGKLLPFTCSLLPADLLFLSDVVGANAALFQWNVLLSLLFISQTFLFIISGQKN